MVSRLINCCIVGVITVAPECVVETLLERDFDEWVRLLSASKEATIYNSPLYLKALCRTTGGRFHILGVRRANELVGGVALYELRSRLGPFVMPQPLIYYNGIILRRYETRYPSEQVARQLKVLEALERALLERHYLLLSLASPASFTDVRVFTARGWTVVPRYTYVVPLTDLQSLWGRVAERSPHFSREVWRVNDRS